MKKLLTILLLITVFAGCGYERLNGYDTEARIIYKITSDFDDNFCFSKYYIKDVDYFSPLFSKEITYVSDTFGKWSVGDTIKLK